jgi:cell division septum initiation protein DivIVA
MTRAVTLLIVGSVIAVGAAVATASSDQTPAQDSPALLNEVRLLRQAIEQLAGNGTRVQIAFGRLQLQEQRTATAARRLEDVRANLTRLTYQATETAERLKDVEGLGTTGNRTPEEEADLREMQKMMTRELRRIEAERARLIAEEVDAASVLASEQGRWSDLNRQLEELERSLAPRPQ